jgi:hypothetical protein
MDRYFLRDVFIFLTYLGAVQWGIHIERSYGCTPTQEVLDFTPRCYSLPIVEDIVSPDSNRCAYSRDFRCDDASLVHGGLCPLGTDTDDCAELLALCGVDLVQRGVYPAGTDPDCAVKYYQARAAERHGTRHPGFHTNQ